MSIKSKLEALIYAAEEPIGIDQMAALLKHDLLALQNQPTQETTEDPESHLGAIEASPVAEDASTPTEVHSTVGPEIPEDRQAAESAPASKKPEKRASDKSEKAVLRNLLKPYIEELVSDFSKEDHGIEIRQVAGGYRMSTKPEHHDVVRAFAKSLKPPIRLSLQALETLAVIAYKQPVTAPEISEIRGVDSSGVLAGLISRKLITTAGRKQVIGRPILYKTTKDFLLRFGLKDLNELPSIEEFEKLTSAAQSDLFSESGGVADATGVPDVPKAEVDYPQQTSTSISENSDEEGHYEDKIVEAPHNEQ